MLVHHFTENVAGVGYKDGWRPLPKDVSDFALDVLDAVMKRKGSLAAEDELSRKMPRYSDLKSHLQDTIAPSLV